MQHKTKGVVISSINYSDKYNLVTIFTDLAGRITYMVSKTKSRSNRVSKSLFSPLAILDLEVEHQASRDIQRIREAHSAFHFFDIPINMGKTSIAFFLSEFLSKVLKDVNDSQLMFDYLLQSVKILEMSDNSVANFHLVFMLKLSRMMGFYPNLEDYSQNSLFDMMNGEFVDRQPLHKHYLNRLESLALSKLDRISYENMHKYKFSRTERILIIDRMLDYYRLHINDFPQLKSLDVLQELF